MEQIEEEVRELPLHLVEKIVSMVPFPYVCKARFVSRAWRTRFSSVSSLRNDEDKLSARSFQSLITEQSVNWDSYQHVVINSVAKQKLDLFGFTTTSRTWQRFPSLSFLPRKFWDSAKLSEDWPKTPEWILQIQGSLLLVTAMERNNFSEEHVELCVANVMTRSWKQLPPRPNKAQGLRGCMVDSKLVHHTQESYKVVFVSARELSSNVQIYDSQTETWKQLELPQLFEPLRGPAAYMDGYLCLMGHCFHLATCSYVIINIDKETLEFKQQALRIVPTNNPRLHVPLEVVVGPPRYRAVLDGKITCQNKPYDDCVYVAKNHDGRVVLSFSQPRRAWRCFPAEVNYAWPNLSPFVEV